MRICHIITTLVYAGAERLLVNCANLHAGKHEVHVIYLKGAPQLLPELHPSIRVHHVPLGLSCFRGLRAKIRDIAPEIVHTHLGHADLLGLAASAGLPVRRFCTMHNVWFKWDWRDHAFFAMYRILFSTVARDCRVIGISECVTRHVRDRLGVKGERAVTLVNAIPRITSAPDRPEARDRLGLSRDRFYVLFVGRLRLQKSVETLLQAAARAREDIPDLGVLIVGEGEEGERLRELARGLSLEGVVEFRGVTSRPEDYFAAADVFALPSVFEGFGLVILEAFRAGRPVIATDIEGPREIVENGRTGLLIPPRRPERLSEAILGLYRDPALRERLARGGQASFEEKYNIDRYAKSLEDLYSRALKR